MHTPLCLCDDLPRIEAAARVTLVAHAAEWRRFSNTGRVAVLALEGAELAVWGVRDQPLDPATLVREAERTVLLYPSEDAPRLVPTDARPVRVLVPDGTWRESRRIASRLAPLPGIEKVRVDAAARPGLRAAPSAGRLGTGEAIAAALEALGDRDAAAQLREAVRTMVERALYVRGKIGHDRVRGGVPLEVRRALSEPR